MEKRELSDDAGRFLRERIGSMRHLDVLLQLQGHPEDWWTAEAIGTALRLPPESVADAADQLAAADLLDVRLGGDVMYRFAPSNENVSALIEEVWPLRYTSRDALVRHLAG